MDDLASKLTPKAILAALNNLPTEVDDIYELAMHRIEDLNEYRRDIAKRFLMWITYTFRPLTTTEIEYAVAILLDTSNIEEDAIVDEDDVIRACDLQSMCAGLIAIDEAGKVGLVHYTAQRYLNKIREELFPDGHAKIAIACMRYTLYHFRDDSNSSDNNEDDESNGAVRAHTQSKYRVELSRLRQKISAVPLLRYASTKWAEHVHESQNQSRDDLVLRLIDNKSSRRAAALPSMIFIQSNDPAPLHVACRFGLINIVALLLSRGDDIEARDSHGWTPVRHAYLRGHQDVVDLMRSSGADMKSVHSYEQSKVKWFH